MFNTFYIFLFFLCRYVCYIEENADPGTSVKFANPNKTVVKDDDVGKTGVFTLQLVNNNGTFEILPSVAERSANFVVSVRDNMLLDYEKYESLSFNVRVYINKVNNLF